MVNILVLFQGNEMKNDEISYGVFSQGLSRVQGVLFIEQRVKYICYCSL